MRAAFYFFILVDLKTVRAFFLEGQNSAAGQFFILFYIANKKNSAGGLETVRAVPENHRFNFIWPNMYICTCMRCKIGY